MAKDKAAKKRKKATRDAQRRRESVKRQVENEEMRQWKQKAPYIKQILRARGHDLPFYYYLDSFESVFKQVADKAVEEHPTLLGVHETSANSPDENFWQPLGYNDLTQIFYKIDDSFADYGKLAGKGKATLEGGMTSFRNGDGELRSIITVAKNPPTKTLNKDMKYSLKLATLFHEIGHVIDLEEGINFNQDDVSLDVIEAEVYAHLHCFEQLAQWNMVMTFETLREGLRDAIPKGGYQAKVSTLVFERLPDYEMVDWQPLLFDVEPTKEEAKLIGPQGQRILGKE